MRAKELRELSLDDLELKRKEFREEIFHLALRRATGQLESPMKVRESRRALARVETEWGGFEEVRYFLEFVRTSKRGICR